MNSNLLAPPPLGTLPYFLFLALFIVGIGIFSFRIWMKWRLLRKAAPAGRFNRWGERMKKTMVYALAQKRILLDPSTGLMHALIFWGFCVLFIHTASLFLGALIPGLGFEESLGVWYAWPKDLVIILVAFAVIYAAVRRALLRPARVDDSAEAYLVLGLIFILMLTDIGTAAATWASGVKMSGFLGARTAPLFQTWPPGAIQSLYSVCWWVQALTILVFLNLLPGSKHFHVITSLPNVFFQKLEPLGQTKTLNLEDENAESFGVSKARELDWKLLLDLYSCTECGRCHEFCPTHTTSKPLSPKRMNDHLKKFVYDHQQELASGATAELPDLFSAGVVKDDEIWSCTTCAFCETACPLFIEEVPWIVDFRRYKTLTESKFPEELTKTFKGLENNSNPWGIGAHKRADWARELGIPIAGETDSFEYLYFVGCSGSFDDRNRKVAVAFARLLQQAGVSFAILGEAEGCCGDAARRTGNEYLFQILAQANIETFKEAGVRKIVTTCPHGYNTLKNEYPDFGGTYEVTHHSQLLEKLILDGRLKPRKTLDLDLAYHDSCYLGRYNNIFNAPRNVLTNIEGVRLSELPLHHEKGYCCGGGGGRVFMEETIGTRINHFRTDQIRQSGCSTVAAACPFCMTMLSDGVNEKAIEGVKVKDIAEVLLEAMGEEGNR